MNKYLLLGDKLSHSKSPEIHKIILDKFNDDATYEKCECSINDLNKLIDDGKKGIYKGFNVTIPYKIEIMKYLDIIDDKALKIGSINTVKFISGKAIGYNTDYDGFKKALEFYNIDAENKNAYILGTGGASKAINSVLKDLNAKTYLVSRDKNKGDLSYLDLKNKDIDILVNTTPVGMYPDIDKSPLDLNIINKAKVVVDIIFNPLKTKLLKLANSEYNGLYMLIYQAIKAEEIWHNKTYDDVSYLYEIIKNNCF